MLGFMQLPLCRVLWTLPNKQLHKEAVMELLPAEVRAGLPKLYSQEGNSDPIVHVKYFTPDSSWTWYATEGEEEEEGDFRFFGYVIGFEREWGYFVLSELQSARGTLGLAIERDLHFKPAPLSEVLQREGGG
jgi:hypothetical protein